MLLFPSLFICPLQGFFGSGAVVLFQECGDASPNLDDFLPEFPGRGAHRRISAGNQLLRLVRCHHPDPAGIPAQESSLFDESIRCLGLAGIDDENILVLFVIMKK